MPEFQRLADTEGGLGPQTDVIESRPATGWGRHGPAALLVALVAVALTASSPAPSREPPATGSQGLLADVSASLVVPGVTLDLPGKITSFDVGPGGYAVVVSEDCRYAPPCTGGIATSDDLRHWRRHRLPSGAMQPGAPVPLVLDRDVVLLRNFGYRYRAWLSRDDGRTWRTVPGGRPQTAREAAGRVSADFRDQVTVSRCGAQRLTVHRRETGRYGWLARQPAGIWPCTATPFPDLAGRLWVAGVDMPSGEHAVVAVSTDLGRHWRTTRLPASGGTSWATVTFAGPDVYAVVVGDVPWFPYASLRAVFRFAGGRGWTTVWRPNGSEPAGLTLVTVCPGGRLLATSEPPGRVGRMLFSRDGGGWSVATGLPPIRATAVPGLGWYGWYPGVGWARPVHSRDCRVWHGIPVD